MCEPRRRDGAGSEPFCRKKNLLKKPVTMRVPYPLNNITLFFRKNILKKCYKILKIKGIKSSFKKIKNSDCI